VSGSAKRNLCRALATLYSACAMLTAEVRLPGRILDENRAPIQGARVSLQPGEEARHEMVSDVRGEFTFELNEAGVYRLSVEKEGYFPIRSQRVEIAGEGQSTEVVLERVREVFESLEVSAEAPAMDMDTTAPRQGISGNDILNVPYPNTNDLRSAMRIIPGVVRDNRGRVHINGGGEEQVMYTLNGFNISDPITNRFETRLSVESVQEIEVASGNLQAQYGKGSSGTMALRTRSGDDRFRYSATNFVPGIENRKGLIIGDWTPRANFSGPVRRGRAWFSNSTDIVYTQTVIQDLPKGDDRISSWRLSNLLTGQVNLTPSNILYTGFLATAFTAPRTGLSVVAPFETTIDRRSRQWFFYVKDQAYLGRHGVVEVGYAANRTFGREIPQGQELFQILPETRRGNHFVDAVRSAGRDQFIVNGFAPTFEAAGEHQVKAGIDLDRVDYFQDVSRTGFENFDERGTRVIQTVFGGSGRLRRDNYEAAVYVQDSWRVRPGLLLEIGARADWGNLLRRWDYSPRLGLAWSPPWWESTKIFGGFARIFDASSLRMFTRPMDQHSLTTYFSPDGAVVRGPAVSLFTIENSRLLRPQYLNWSLGFQRQWGGGFTTRTEVIQRRGNRGFTYLNSLTDGGAPPGKYVGLFPGMPFDSVYNLTNERVDRYRALSFTIRQNFGRQYEWMASYTASEARSNAVVEVNQDDPISVVDNEGRMPWDAPHRFLSWGYLPTPWKNWAVSHLVDTRTGFPFNVVGSDGAVAGRVSSNRFPYFLELNLHLERKFEFRGHRWAFRFGANNITNRRNPDVVINTVGSSQFLKFFGGVGRSTNFRIRWLGRS